MKWLRALTALLAIAASVSAAWLLVVPRLGCNRDKAVVNAATIRLDRGPADDARTAEAMQLATICRRCLEQFPNDYEFHLLLGSNQQFYGDFDGAEQSFRRSLALSERPETLAYLAVMQLERGRPEEARQNLYRAALFNLSFVELVSDPLRTEIAQAVTARHQRLGSPDPVDQWRRRRARLYQRRAVPNV
jgi:tetratricopeptide (TPR) repeat protein